MKTLTSRDNPRFKQLRKWVNQARARNEAGLILVEGLHLIEALLAAHGHVEEIVLSETAYQKAEIQHYLNAHPTVPILLIPDKLFKELSDTVTPAGVLALAKPPMSPAGIAPDQQKDCILLDGIQDPGNLGTLIRTAAAAGITQALLSPSCADAWSTKALRAGQGAQFYLRIYEHYDLVKFLKVYQGVSWVTQPTAPQSLYEISLNSPIAWIFGAEGQGVSAPVSAAAQAALHIPMPGPTESLNVAAAAAICLFEMLRYRQSKAYNNNDD